MRRVTTADGLPNDQVRAILRDKRGFLWFGTQDGLSRFDGVRFRNYGTDDGLPTASILSLLETRDGTLWVGTETGLCRFAPEAPAGHLFDCHTFDASPLSRSVLSLLEDRTGTLWAGTADGLFQVDSKRAAIRAQRVELPVSLPGALEVGALAEDHAGCLWLGTMEGLFRRCGTLPFRHFQLLPRERDNNRVFGLLVDGGGRIWAGLAYDGVLVLEPGGPDWSETRNLIDLARRSRTSRTAAPRQLRLPQAAGEALDILAADGLASSRARGGLFESTDGTIWIGTAGGLSRFDGERVQRFGDFADAIVFAGAADRAGDLWFGTSSSGALRLNTRGFVTYDETDGLAERRIRAVFRSHDGAVHALAAPNVVCRFNGSRLDGHRFSCTVAPLPAGINLGWGHHQLSFQDSQGEWWIATGEGLFRFPAGQRTSDLGHARPLALYTTKDGLGGNDVFRLYEDSRHDLWIGTTDGARLTLWQRATGTFRSPLAEAGLPLEAPTAFAEDRAGGLWIGFYHGGLARLASGRFTFFPPGRNGVPASWVNDLYVDSAGHLWIASRLSGLSRIDDPSTTPLALRHYSLAEGLSSTLASCVVEDSYHRIYVCSGRGVDRLDPSTGEVAHLSLADGLASTEINSAMRDSSGDLWFATTTGLSRLSPRPTSRAAPPESLLTALQVDGRAQRISEIGSTELAGLELRPGQRQLEIAFVAIGSEPGEATRYQHRLEGVDRDWTAPDTERRVVYDDLRPAGYEFRVRALATDGRPGPPARLLFRVLPPWWRQPWVIALGLAALCGAAYGGHRLRTAHLVSLERVRTRIATDLHDELGANLSRIALLSEVAAREIPADGDRSRTIVREIGGLARELFDSTADIVWAIDPRRDNLGSLVARLSEYARDVLAASGASWSLAAPPGLDSVPLPTDVRRELFLLLKEAVHNVARHSGASAASLTVRLEGATLRAEVSDNGRGLAAAPAGGGPGNGLRNMRARAEALRGACVVRSVPDAGTQVQVELPISR